jgi:hypothetical protein
MKLKSIFKHLIKYGVIGIVVIALILAICYGISFLLTCAAVKLVTVLFGWPFYWDKAAVIWGILLIVHWLFTDNKD